MICSIMKRKIDDDLSHVMKLTTNGLLEVFCLSLQHLGRAPC